ncbi:hypothetical protein [Jiulongibacter sp. NS-SX5]
MKKMNSTDKNKDKTKVNSEHLTIHDCLKLIGLTEITANVYSTNTKKTRG